VSPSTDDLVDEPLERVTLPGRRRRPPVHVDGLSLLDHGEPEQVLEPLFADERVPLDVEEEVARVELRKLREAGPRLRLTGFPEFRSSSWRRACPATRT
jgi:hypothetical protein